MPLERTSSASASEAIGSTPSHQCLLFFNKVRTRHTPHPKLDINQIDPLSVLTLVQQSFPSYLIAFPPAQPHLSHDFFSTFFPFDRHRRLPYRTLNKANICQASPSKDMSLFALESTFSHLLFVYVLVCTLLGSRCVQELQRCHHKQSVDINNNNHNIPPFTHLDSLLIV